MPQEHCGHRLQEITMLFLEETIRNKGAVYPGNVLKVDSFLNHQIDVAALDRLGEEFARRFAGKSITKILTIEASGIAVACSAARCIGVPVVYAKKTHSKNIGMDVYSSRVFSYTHDKEYDIIVSAQFVGRDDSVLILDDFLALGNAVKGLIGICGQAGASIAGIGICIEKAFQHGGDELRNMGYDVQSLAVIEKMSDDGNIVFRTDEQG